MDARFLCPIPGCNKQYCRSSRLVEHGKEAHGRKFDKHEVGLSCEVCGAVYYTANFWKRHVEKCVGTEDARTASQSTVATQALAETADHPAAYDSLQNQIWELRAKVELLDKQLTSEMIARYKLMQRLTKELNREHVRIWALSQNNECQPGP